MARSGRGFGGNSAAMGQAQSGMAQVSANAANESAQLRAQEDAAAKQRQLQALQTSLQGGLGLQSQYGGQAQFNTQTALAQQQANDAKQLAENQLALNYQQYGTNAGLGYGQQALNYDQLAQGYRQFGDQTEMGYRELGEQNNLQHQQLGQQALNNQAEYELAQQQMWVEAQKANQGADLEKDAGNTSVVGSIFGAMFSDRESKEEIKRLRGVVSSLKSSLGEGGDADALETVKNAQAYSYKYKNPNQPGAKPGRMVGPMAQDLERGPLGDSVITDTPQGKMVDPGRLTMINSSAIAEQQRQLDALKRSLGKKAA
jgi:hypothetical protein